MDESQEPGDYEVFIELDTVQPGRKPQQFIQEDQYGILKIIKCIPYPTHGGFSYPVKLLRTLRTTLKLMTRVIMPLNMFHTVIFNTGIF